MNSHATSHAAGTLLVLLAALAGDLRAAGPTADAAAPAASSRFTRVRDQIDDLFRRRDGPPAAPEARHNPFRERGAAEALDETADPPPATKLALAQQRAAAMKASGTFESGGRVYCVINGRSYQSGDLVAARASDAPHLRVNKISRRSITLALDGVEVLLKF